MNITAEALKASKCLDKVVRVTQCIKTNNFNTNYNLYLKQENLQITGSFKIRGAYYKISKLTSQEKKLGVICASAGNHAQGVAYACNSLNIKATIVMPINAPLSKISATEKYGATVVLYGDNFDEAYEHAKKIQSETSAIFVEPFNDLDVIAGQATIAVEILNQIDDVDVILVPIGGGGLASGVSAYVKSINPQIKIIGVEARNVNSMQRSISEDKIICMQNVSSIADGISVKKPGNITFEYCKEYLDGIISVDEEEITSAILRCIEKEKSVIEAAGAVTLAAAMYHANDFEGKNVVCILSGGNIDVTMISKIIDRGLVKTGRKLSIGTLIKDTPGQLKLLIDLLSTLKCNIISITHDRSDIKSTPGNCYVEINLETSNQQHINKILKELENLNFTIFYN